ncbi:gliding motility-associated protein GldM [Pedobacter glucosidilyticus]|nr:gliding motility protein GldM [Pedobacter glucosidilyticus]KHJ38647.1 gliding motility-associated protein GldM [Pedobacter glucosidilyticus]
MAGGKETPRQKMIGIMYLVLMAMLAINVSDTILNAFSTINNSLKTSTANVNTSLTQSVSAFEQTKLKENPERAKPILDKIKQVQAVAAELNVYLDAVRKELIEAGGGIVPETGEIKNRDDLDVSPRIMWSDGNKKNGKGYLLQTKVNETRDKLLNILDPRDRASVSFSLEAKDSDKRTTSGTKADWVQSNFGEGTPVTASVTILSKIEADAKNAENVIVRKLLSKMDEALVNLDAFAAVAVAPTSYVIQGQPYTAEVFLTAYDSKQNPDIVVNGSKLSTKDGRGVYSVNTNSEGEFKWKGTIRVKQTDGTEKIYETPEQTYRVARPSAVVSPDKMNVFYIGPDNPVSVSAPGIAKEKLKVSMTGGSLSGGNGKYVARVSGGSQAVITVSAEVAPGKTQILGTTNFRIKEVPPPIATFAGKASGTISASAARSTGKLEAELRNFDFDFKYKISKFTLYVQKPRQDAIILQSSDDNFSGQIRQVIGGLNPGDVVYFLNISAVGETGKTVALETPVSIQVGR